MTLEVLNPASRAEWLGLRRNTIGASEVAALFGAHPFLTAYELHHLKAGTIAADPTETGPMRRGRMLEQVAIEFLREERPGWTVNANTIPGGRFYRDPEAGLSCTPDAFVHDPARRGQIGIQQIKSVEPSVYRRSWLDEDGNPEPPLHVALQVIQEAHLTGADYAIVTPLVIGHEVDMPVLEVPIHPGVIGQIEAKAAAFWQGVARGEAPDPDYGRDGQTIARLYLDDNGQEADLSADEHLAELVIEHDRLGAEIRAAAVLRDRIAAEIKHRIGPYERARVAGGRRITWRTQTRALRFQPPSESRVLRISKAL